MTHPAVSLSSVSFNYEKTPVLTNVSLAIPDKSFTAIIGPNGGGKSTLIKLMLGLLKPQKGTCKLFNEKPIGTSKKVAYVPQTRDFDLKFPVTVFDVVLMGLYHKLNLFGFYSAECKVKAKKALSIVGLSGFEKRSFGTLSGGQAQRVLIARALIVDPKILILDEPTASVDFETKNVILKLLLERKQKMAIILVTHEIDQIISEVDHVFVVQNTVTSYPPKELCHHFAMGVYHEQKDKGPS